MINIGMFRNVVFIKAILYIVILIPLFEIVSGIYNAVFFDPIDEILEITGITTLRLLIVALCITPLVDIFGWKRLYIYRRMVGVSGFCYLVLHGVVWLFRQEFNLDYMVGDIIGHNYIIVGLVSFLLLFVLTVTSTNFAIKSMGIVKWKKLHRFTYPAAFLGALHYLMQDKSGFSLSPYIYMGIIVCLLFYRLVKVSIVSMRK